MEGLIFKPFVPWCENKNVKVSTVIYDLKERNAIQNMNYNFKHELLNTECWKLLIFKV